MNEHEPDPVAAPVSATKPETQATQATEVPVIGVLEKLASEILNEQRSSALPHLLFCSSVSGSHLISAVPPNR